MKTVSSLAVLCVLLSACSWNFYNDENGQTKIERKYPVGTSTYYQDGTYQHDQRYNQFRPVQKAVE